jgi:hypothetical protein
MKTQNLFLHWLQHYVYGLFAQTFKGAVTTAVVLVNDAISGKLAGGVTWANVWHPLLISMLSFALIYFNSHPFPDDLSAFEPTLDNPNPPPTPTPASAASKLNAAAQ